MQPRRDIVDVSLLGPPEPAGAPDPVDSRGPGLRGRPYLRVYFACANQYVRVYRNGSGDGYCARCPACGKTMDFAVGPEGTGERFFRLTCR
ncbi:MAG: hypothetical protein KIT68_13050 [Phycisphaeraceae bacterium]|nr:hypothetical protein [Phycisphaeraceae bacterium]